MALRSVLEQFKHGGLRQNVVSNSGNMVPPVTKNCGATQVDLFTLDDDSLFEPDKDLFGPTSLSHKGTPTPSTQTKPSHSNQQPPSTTTRTKSSVTPAPSTSNHSVSTQNKDSIVSSNTSKAGTPHFSSIQKLKSFKFVKTSGLLGKRGSSAQDVTGSGTISKDEIGPPLSKKSAPLVEDYLFDDITADDIMDMDDALDIDTGRSCDDHVINSSQTELFSTPINQEPMTLSNSPIREPHSSSHSTSTHHQRRTSNSPSYNQEQNSLFKTPTIRVKDMTTTHNKHTTSDSHLTNRIPTSLETPPSQKNVSSTPTKGFNSTPHLSTPLSQSQQSSTPSVFRTPVSRQPRAVVCTPSGDECAPVVMRASTSGRRKFPGPAGLLPSLAPGQCMDNIYIQPPSTPRPASTPRVQGLTVSRECSTEEECFSSGPWVTMLQDLDVNDSHSSALLQYSIANAINQARSKRLSKGKVPHLRVLLKSIAPAGRNASAVLKDPSGEILCTIHSKVFEDHQRELQPGAAIILRQVSLFSPAPRKHYLNITPDNIIRVYPPEPFDPSPQGILDLSKIERVFNSENISPPSKGLTSNRTSLTVPPQSVRRTLPGNFADPPSRRRATLSEGDSLSIITQETDIASSSQGQTNLKDDSEKVVSKRCSVFGAQLSDVGRREDTRNKDSVMTRTDKSSSERKEGSFFDQFCDDDFDAIIGDVGDEAFNF